MSLKEKLLNTFVSPVVHGGVSAVALKLLYMDKKAIPLFGSEVSIPAAGFAVGATANFVSELFTTWLLPHIEKERRLENIEASLVKMGMTGALFVSVPFLVNGFNMPNTEDLLKFFGTGVVGEMVSSYVYGNYVENILNVEAY